jgi:hypothetical protein
MILNSQNCFNIEGYGIYIYFPEINKLCFYEQKRDKDFTFNPDDIKLENGFISFQRQDSTDKLFLNQLFKDSNGLKNYILKFEEYFKKRHLEQKTKPEERLIDFLIMNKKTRKIIASFSHDSPEEVRIIYIDWSKNLILYYGNKDSIQTPDLQIYDVKIPYPHMVYEMPLREQSFDTYYNTNFSTIRNLQFKKFIFQYFLPQNMDTLLSIKHQETDMNLTDYLRKLRLLNATQSVEQLLDCFNSSELKESWFKYADTKIQKGIVPIYDEDLNLNPKIPIPQEQKSHVIIDDYYIREKDENPLTGMIDLYKLKDDITTPYSLKYIHIKIDGVLYKIDFTENELNQNKFGSNYFLITRNINGTNYGIKFSKNIFTPSYEFDLIIEMLTNSVSYFILNKLKLESVRTLIASIPKIISCGVCNVNIEKTRDYNLKGLIMYTVFEMQENPITLSKLINEILDDASKTEIEIKSILCRILLQIYNFYSLMYPSIKFESNNFTSDNIILIKNSDGLYDVLIIDFGLAKIDLRLDNSTYKLFKRKSIEDTRFKMGQDNTIINTTLYPQVKSEPYSKITNPGDMEYKKNVRSSIYFEKFIKSIYETSYISSQSDLATLILSLVFNSVTDQTKANINTYLRVMEECFVSIHPYLKKLTLDYKPSQQSTSTNNNKSSHQSTSTNNNKPSQQLSYFKKQELDNYDLFAGCLDLFLFELQQLRIYIKKLNPRLIDELFIRQPELDITSCDHLYNGEIIVTETPYNNASTSVNDSKNVEDSNMNTNTGSMYNLFALSNNNNPTVKGKHMVVNKKLHLHRRSLVNSNESNNNDPYSPIRQSKPKSGGSRKTNRKTNKLKNKNTQKRNNKNIHKTRKHKKN